MDAANIKEIESAANKKVTDKIGIWHAVSTDAYSILVDASKIKHDEILSESESITTKAISMLSALLIFIGSFIGYLISHSDLIQKEYSFLSLIFGCLLSIITIASLVYIIAPRQVITRGVSPENIIPKGIDQRTNEKHQKQMVYFTYLVSLQYGIDFNSTIIKSRSFIYNISLRLFALTMIYMPIIAVYFIS